MSTSYSNSTKFIESQSWSNLSGQCLKWEDSESVLLLATLYCNLSIGKITYQLLTSTDALPSVSACLDRLIDLEESGQNQNSCVNVDLTVFMRTSEHCVDAEVLTERTIQSYFALISKGHAMPAKLMLIFIEAAFRVEHMAVMFLQRGALALLHCMCICQGQTQTVRDRARDCLLGAMTQSAHVRERVLDSLLDLSGGLAQIPSAIGPDPSVVARATCDVDDGEEASEEVAAERQELTSLGHFDVAVLLGDDELQRRQLASHRDVEWIPTSGTSWSLSSVLLWSRCPALRDLIGGFWEDGGGGLELSIRACDEVLSSLCRYIHTGMVLLPLSLDKRLQLLRVSAELEMSALYQAIRPVLASALTAHNVSLVLRFAEDNDLPDLQWLCDGFIRSGHVVIKEVRFASGLPTADDSQLASSTGHEATRNALNRSHRSSSESLREAISASLQDVTEALAERQLFPSRRSRLAPTAQDDSDGPLDEFADITINDILMQPDELSFERLNGVVCNDSSLFVAAQEYRPEFAMQQVSPIRQVHSGNKYAKSRSGKSGGIYGLLLESQNESNMVVPRESQQMRKPSAKSGTPTKAVVLVPSASTPRTQRATSLLAKARPSGGISNEADSRFGDSTASFAEEEEEEEWVSGGGAGILDDFDGATEFDGKMSLAPARKPTTAQKRLQDMAKPRKAPTSKKATPCKDEDPVEEMVAKSEKTIAKDRGKAVNVVHRNAASTAVNAKSDVDSKLVKLEPKRAVSPMTTRELDANSAKVKQSQSLSGSSFPLFPAVSVGQELAEGSDFQTDRARDPPPLESVRGSLTLLKTRATRRRRSVAEVEAAVDDAKEEDADRSPIPVEAVESTSASLVVKSTRPFSAAVHDDSPSQKKDEKEGQGRRLEDKDGGVGGDSGDAEATCECPDCGRRFNAIPFEKHVKICAKVFLQKRKTFDSSKMRAEAIPELKERLGGEVAAAQRKKGKKGAESKGPPIVVVATGGPKKWLDESNAFRNAMKAARAVQMAVATGAPLPPVIPSAPDLSLTQCPHCMRRFNDKAAERHIGHCQNIRAKPSSLKRGSGINASSGSITPGYSTLAGSSNKSKKW